jgi:hypothetical protein
MPIASGSTESEANRLDRAENSPFAGFFMGFCAGEVPQQSGEAAVANR